MSAPMDWMQRLFQGIGGQQQPPDMSNPYGVDMAIQQAMQQQQRAQAMQMPQVGAGRGSFLAGLAQMLGGRALEARSGETLKEALSKRFEMDNARRTAEAEQKRLDDEKAWQRKLDEIEAAAAARAKHRQPAQPSFEQQLFEQLPPEMRGKAAMGKFGLLPQNQPQPGFDERMFMALSPEQQQAAIQQKFGIAPKEQTLTAQDIKLIQAEDQRRVSLENATDLVGRLTDLTKQGVGGPIAASGLNPFTNRVTPAGQAIESYDAMAAQLADEITRLTRIPGIGAQSDAELRAALAAIPTSDKNEATRMQMLQQIAKKIERLKNSPSFFEISRGQHDQPHGQQQAAPGMTGDPEEGQTATNPQTGQRIVKRNGQWVPL